MGTIRLHNMTKGGHWAPSGLDVHVKIKSGPITLKEGDIAVGAAPLTVTTKVSTVAIECSSKYVRSWQKAKLDGARIGNNATVEFDVTQGSNNHFVFLIIPTLLRRWESVGAV